MKTMKSKFGMRGFYKIITLRAKPKFISKKIWLKMYHAGLIDFMIKRESPVISNLIVQNTNRGIALFFQHLGGVTTFPLDLSLASIGTGTNAPADADTDLQTPVVTDIDRSTATIGLDNIVTEWFITNDDLPNGTYNEFGLFCGTRLFARSIISPAHTKADNEDTLIEYTITGTN